MDRQDRRAAVAAYKERPPAWGLFVIQCTATGQAWVGCSRHIDSQKNGLWFALKQGSSPFADIQKAWAACDEADFRFEELDRLAVDHPPMSRVDELRRRQALWSARLQAEALPFA